MSLKKLLFKLSLPFILLFSQACSMQSLLTSEALIGTAVGAATGTAGGYFVGEEIGKRNENMALIGGLGAGVGALAGGLLYEEGLKSSQKKLVVMREARLIGQNQREIDSLREDLHDSSVWGQLEVKPWNERYKIDEDAASCPYQGLLQ